MQAYEPLPNRDMLGRLLHSLSQPLTALHCSLELSADQGPEPSAVVSAALEQTDRVIEIIRLMREYLDSEQQRAVSHFFPVAAAMQEVLEQVSAVAGAREIMLLASLRSNVAIAVSEFWLHRALHYLIASLVEVAPHQGAIIVLLEERSPRCLLSAHILPGAASENRIPTLSANNETLQQARLAIARRVMESGGATLQSYVGENSGFLVSIPHLVPQSSQRFA